MKATMRESAHASAFRARLCAALALVLSLAASACYGTKQSQVRRYHLKGRVVQVDKAQQHLVIDHEEIPGFMGR